jgi:phosphatidyl-myo-inositol alpha-mannosyltransferase
MGVRVAFACPYAWDDPGGVQVHVRELAGYMVAEGHDVLVLAPVRHRASERWVHAVGRPVDVTYNRSNAPIDPRPWSFLRAREELRAFRPDVVHVHEPFTPSTSMWATLAAEAPVVATFHTGAERSRLYDLAAPLIRRIARRIVVRVAVSEVAERAAAARIGGSFEIVPNGADIGRFADAEPAVLGEGPKLLFVGRLDERKGFPTAVSAFERLAIGRPALRLIVVGDGPERSAIDGLSPDVRARVTMLGSVPNVDLPPFEKACDLYLGTSVGGESFGVVLVEAMAAGLPVVASDIPGYDEVVTDGVEGFLVPPRNPEAVAQAAESILGDPDLAARFSAAGLARAATFDWPIVGARLEALYRRAVATGPLR